MTTDFLSDQRGEYINAGRHLAQVSSVARHIRAKVKAVQGTYQFAIYADNRGDAGKLLAVTAQTRVDSTGWHSFELLAPVDLKAGTPYWLAVWSDTVDSRIFADRVSAIRYGKYAYSATWPTSVKLPGRAPYRYSLYVTD